MMRMSTAPFDGLLQLQRDLERALGASMFGFEGTRSVFPPLNIFAEPDGVIIRAEVPGFKAEHLEISVEPQALMLTGKRSADDTPPGSYHRRERQHGSFSRSVTLPKDLDTTKATAECRNGLLTIRIPKAEGAKPKQIPVRKAA